MPTSAALVTRLRRFLDDFETTHRKGLQWSDTTMYLALNAAQFAIVRTLFLKQQWHLISELESSVAGASPIPVPNDYMFIGAATAASPSSRQYPAVVFMGWSGREFFDDPTRYVAYVRNDNIEFRRGTTAVSGRLTYWRRPTAFAAATNHTEFIDPVYDIIVYHAAAILQQKDLGTCRRAMTSIEAILKKITQEPLGMYPQAMQEGRDA